MSTRNINYIVIYNLGTCLPCLLWVVFVLNFFCYLLNRFDTLQCVIKNDVYRDIIYFHLVCPIVDFKELKPRNAHMSVLSQKHLIGCFLFNLALMVNLYLRVRYIFRFVDNWMLITNDIFPRSTSLSIDRVLHVDVNKVPCNILNSVQHKS